jgi:HTH-type transcriptional regulator/antitoxin HigA
MAARRSNVEKQVSATQLTWLACVRRQAEQRRVSKYSPDRLRMLAKRLSRDVRDPAAFAELPARFAEAGVRLVYVEAFPSSKIDGAAFDMDGSPVIGLSGRGHRLDKVLFTLLHETAHVVREHIEDGVILDEDDSRSKIHEEEADELAAEWAIPGRLPVMPERASQAWLGQVADVLGVHPIVVVGRLQKHGVLSWRTALAKDAPTVTRYLQDW